jgi:hypothetical protein
MQRFEVNDSHNEFYTRFRYKPITGIGYEKGVSRRDPSTIIRVGDLYYVWYTHCTEGKYYLAYQAECMPERNPEGLNVVGMAIQRRYGSDR